LFVSFAQQHKVPVGSPPVEPDRTCLAGLFWGIKMANLKRLQNKLDALALDQLREVAANLYEELEQTKAALMYAEESADFWRDQVCNMQEDLIRHNQENINQLSIGMMQTGELAIISQPN